MANIDTSNDMESFGRRDGEVPGAKFQMARCFGVCKNSGLRQRYYWDPKVLGSLTKVLEDKTNCPKCGQPELGPTTRVGRGISWIRLENASAGRQNKTQTAGETAKAERTERLLAEKDARDAAEAKPEFKYALITGGTYDLDEMIEGALLGQPWSRDEVGLVLQSDKTYKHISNVREAAEAFGRKNITHGTAIVIIESNTTDWSEFEITEIHSYLG